MIVTDTTRKALASRRECRYMEKRGFRRHETDWEILRGFRVGETIKEAVISCDGLYVYTRIGK